MTPAGAWSIAWGAWSLGLGALAFLPIGIGYRSTVNAAVPPAGAYTIEVTMRDGDCGFSYPGGLAVDERIVIPKHRSIRLVMSAIDAPHRWFLPGLKRARRVLPGTYATAWFQADDASGLVMECPADGPGRSIVPIVALEAAEFEEWLEKGGQETMPPPEYGRRIFARLGCATCHRFDDIPASGPSLLRLAGRTELLEDGSGVVVDASFLRESLVSPSAKVLRGYPAIMPAVPSSVTPAQLDALVAFLLAESSPPKD